MKYDFQGWATKYNILCPIDGRTILPGAFKEQNGAKVPLVWGHIHDDPTAVLGHAMLEARPEGIFCYGVFNDTEQGRNAKILVDHGDVDSVSICANQLKQTANKGVLHGVIRELSLVLAGANEGARIEPVLAHSGEDVSELIVYTDEYIMLNHSDEEIPEIKPLEDAPSDELAHEDDTSGKESDELAHKDDTTSKESDEKTPGEIYESLNEEQQTLFMALTMKYEEQIDALKEQLGQNKNKKEESTDMKHSLFEEGAAPTATQDYGVLTHADLTNVIELTKRRNGRFGETMRMYLADKAKDVLQHDGTTEEASEGDVTYGVRDLDIMFPDATLYGDGPIKIDRDQSWVSKFVDAAKHSPFSRIKCVYADLTPDEARAKGYTKGNRKDEEVFRLLKRSTRPCTVYKKQKLDRDDILDLGRDWLILPWLKGEMRPKLDEEVAVSALIGDGRSSSDADKVDETCIRPIVTDADLFTIKINVNNSGVATTPSRAKNFINAVMWNRRKWKGTGTPTLFTTEEILSECLMLTDEIGRDLYPDVSRLATKLRVKEIVTVEVMEQRRPDIYGVLFNPADYVFGTDKGGEVNFFDDFDIDFNQQKFLMETRLSGSLVVPFSAMLFYTASVDMPEVPFSDRGGHPTDYTGPYDPRNATSGTSSGSSDSGSESSGT